MNLEEAVKIGFLLIPPQGFLRKTWAKRFCAIYNSSNHGIQRIELFESEDAFIKQNPNKIIPLTDCVKVSPAPQKQQINVFEVRTKDNAYQFSAETFQDMADWLVAFQHVAFGKISKSHQIAPKDEKQEENMLYSSMDEPEVFSVNAVSTEATQRNKLIGDYKLVITPVNLSIAEESSQGRIGKIIFTWPYRHIRRYGCTTENFSFEAGRKCSSGEGLFTFATNDGMLIFQSVDAHVLALKSSQNESDIPNSPSLQEDKNNFFSSKDSLLSNRDSTYFSNIHKLEQPYSVSEGSDYKSSSLDKISTLKSIAPVSKPPRKSKTSKYVQNATNISHTNEASNENLEFSNVYEELFRGTSLSSHAENPTQPSKPYSNCEPVKINETVLCSNAEKLSINDVPQKHDPTFVTSCDYENCDPFLRGHSVPKADHVYGKLTNIRQSLPSRESTHIYGTIFPKRNSTTENAAGPVYSNVPFTKDASKKKHSEDYRRDPDHFIKNDAEYAQVFKKSEDNLV